MFGTFLNLKMKKCHLYFDKGICTSIHRLYICIKRIIYLWKKDIKIWNNGTTIFLPIIELLFSCLSHILGTHHSNQTRTIVSFNHNLNHFNKRRFIILGHPFEKWSPFLHVIIKLHCTFERTSYDYSCLAFGLLVLSYLH